MITMYDVTNDFNGVDRTCELCGDTYAVGKHGVLHATAGLDGSVDYIPESLKAFLCPRCFLLLQRRIAGRLKPASIDELLDAQYRYVPKQFIRESALPALIDWARHSKAAEEVERGTEY